MPRPARVRTVNAAQAGAYVRKADEYLAAATSELRADRAIAATSLAIHAGINAADAVTGLRLGQRVAGKDHDEAIRLLRAAGPDGTAVAKELARLLPLKTRAEYEPDDIPKSDAAKAVERAHRIVGVARRIAAARRSDWCGAPKPASVASIAVDHRLRLEAGAARHSRGRPYGRHVNRRAEQGRGHLSQPTFYT